MRKYGIGHVAKCVSSMSQARILMELLFWFNSCFSYFNNSTSNHHREIGKQLGHISQLQKAFIHFWYSTTRSIENGFNIALIRLYKIRKTKRHKTTASNRTRP